MMSVSWHLWYDRHQHRKDALVFPYFLGYTQSSGSTYTPVLSCTEDGTEETRFHAVGTRHRGISTGDILPYPAGTHPIVDSYH
jgi:hypothetical protein